MQAFEKQLLFGAGILLLLPRLRRHCVPYANDSTMFLIKTQ